MYSSKYMASDDEDHDEYHSQRWSNPRYNTFIAMDGCYERYAWKLSLASKCFCR